MLLLWSACRTAPELPERDFDASFVFGTATAGFQVETGCPGWTDCAPPPSDWATYVTDPLFVGDPSLYLSGDPLSAGPGMWETFEDDVTRMSGDGMTGFRLGLEWARLFPDGGAEAAVTVDQLDAFADPAAVARYHEMFAALDAAGITPLVTLNHYVLPLWVHEPIACHADPLGCPASGWVDRQRIVRLIGLYAGWCAREFGGEVDRWFTLNEPFATTVSGYLLPTADRSAPPGVFLQLDAALAVMTNQIEGHAAMVDAVRAEDRIDADDDGAPTTVGIVMNFAALTPKDGPEDDAAVAHADYLYHALYLDAVTTGAWDDDLDGVPDRTRDDLAGRLDVLGINYYNQLVVDALPGPVFTALPVFDFGFTYSAEPYPEGLREVLERGAAWGVPLWVTENGTPFVEDRGVEILDGHLDALDRAMDDGVDVRGYLYWSYVDNYEWNHGMDLSFGLYGLDPVTKARIERPVAARLREVATTGRR